MSNLLTYESRRMFKYMAVLNPTGYYEDHILCHFQETLVDMILK